MNFVAGFGWLGHPSTAARNTYPHGGLARAVIGRFTYPHGGQARAVIGRFTYPHGG